MRASLASAAAAVLALALAVPGASLGPLTAPSASVADPGGEPATTLPGARIRGELEGLAALLQVEPQPLELGPCPSYEEAVRQHFGGYGLQAPERIPSPDDPALERAVACLLDAMHAADLARVAMLKRVGADLPRMLEAIAREDIAALEAMPAPDLGVALGAALTLASLADDALRALDASPPVPAHEGRTPPEIDLFPVLALDRTGDTFYDCDYALVLDERGNDLYDNNAGGTWLAVGPVSFFFLAHNPNRCSMLLQPLGPDTPAAAVGGEMEFGLLITTAMLLDTDGSDIYGVRKPPVLDAECTSDPVVRRIGAEGAGIIGVGMLFDTAGNNHLIAKTLSQGMGHSGGVGVISMGPGDDVFEAVRSAQGSGVLGAIGVLVEEGGNDRYVGVVPRGGTANIDLSFCDDTSRYMQGAGFGRLTGVATSLVGLLRDLAGNDYYEGDSKVQGNGEVFAHGILLEHGGDDTYVADTKAMGFAEGHESTGGTGTGWFFDVGGDDTYLLGAAPGLGMGSGKIADPDDLPPPYIPPNLWANDVINYAVNPLLVAGGTLFLDDGQGADSYSLASRHNDQVAVDSLVGLFVDR